MNLKIKNRIIIILMAFLLLFVPTEYYIDYSLSNPKYETFSYDLDIEYNIGDYYGVRVNDLDFNEDAIAVLLSNGTIIIFDDQLNFDLKFQIADKAYGEFLFWLSKDTLLLGYIVNNNNTLSTYNINTSELTTLLLSDRIFIDIKFDQTNNRLAVNLGNKTVSVYDIYPEFKLVNSIKSTNLLGMLKWSSDGSILYSIDTDVSIYTWSAGDEFDELLSLNDTLGFDSHIDAHYGKEILLVHDMHKLVTVDYLDGEIISTYNLSSSHAKWYDIGSMIICGSYRETVIITDLTQKETLFNFSTSSPIAQLFTKESMLFAVTDNNIIHLWIVNNSYSYINTAKNYHLNLLFLVILIPVLLYNKKQKNDISMYPKVNNGQ